MLIFKNENQFNKNHALDDYSAYEHFFSIFVHEITNPLSSIKMAAQIVEKSKVYDHELLEIIKNECSRISKIINSISQISSKLVLKNKSQENIHEVLRYSTFKLKNQSQQIQIIEEFDPSIPKVSIDKSLLIQVFENLLNNFFEASIFSPKSFISVRIKKIYAISRGNSFFFTTTNKI